MTDSQQSCIAPRRLASWWPVASVEVAELGDVLVGAFAVDFDIRQLHLDPAELLIGQVDVGGAEVLLDALSLREPGIGTMKGFL
jgi:hypothetical protein